MTHISNNMALRDPSQLAMLKERLISQSVMSAEILRLLGATADARQGMAPTMRRHFDALVEAGAATDAALALIDGALPGWKLRRLVYDDGEWHCALSQRRELPDWLDEAAEGCHASRSIALMLAVVEALGQASALRRGAGGAVPRAMPVHDGLICCENYT